MAVNGICFQCQKEFQSSHEIGRKDECPQCHSDLRVCKNCQFYSQQSHFDCAEPQAEWVKEKDRANFCDYFQVHIGAKNQQNQKQDLLAAAEALFRKK